MIAIDTNILIYACDKSDARRQQIALDLIAEAVDGILLWQVACEFVAASRKPSAQGFTAAHAWSRLSEFVGVLRLALPTAGILERARTLHVTHGVSFWDATIWRRASKPVWTCSTLRTSLGSIRLVPSESSIHSSETVETPRSRRQDRPGASVKPLVAACVLCLVLPRVGLAQVPTGTISWCRAGPGQRRDRWSGRAGGQPRDRPRAEHHHR